MTDKPEIVLVGTSLDLPSDRVVQTGAELARQAGAELHLFHAFPLPTAYFVAPTGLAAIPPDLLETEKQLHEGMLDEQLRRVGIARREVAGEVVQAGVAHRLLLETADELDASLLVVGASEHPALLPGSTADRILRAATCPVWVVAEKHALPPKRVLAPVDLSELSADCLRRGVRLLEGFGLLAEATIDTLFVLTSEERESSQFTPEQLERLGRDELRRLIDRIDRKRRLRWGRRVRGGEVRREIRAEIEHEPTDLVLVGTHGRSGFERFLIGSVASDLAREAPCDILVVPPARPHED